MTPLIGKVRALFIKAPEVLDQKEARSSGIGEINRVIEKIKALEVIGLEEITITITEVAIMKQVATMKIRVAGNRGMTNVVTEGLILGILQESTEKDSQRVIEKVRDRSLITKNRARENNIDNKLKIRLTQAKIFLLGLLM